MGPIVPAARRAFKKASDRSRITREAVSFAAPGLRRVPNAGERHAGMADGIDGLYSRTALQFEPGRGVYQGGVTKPARIRLGEPQAIGTHVGSPS